MLAKMRQQQAKKLAVTDLKLLEYGLHFNSDKDKGGLTSEKDVPNSACKTSCVSFRLPNVVILANPHHGEK